MGEKSGPNLGGESWSWFVSLAHRCSGDSISVWPLSHVSCHPEVAVAGCARECEWCCRRELPLQDVCTALRDAGTPNGALRSPRIAEGKERRGQERRQRGRGHFPGLRPSLCQSPAEGNRSKWKRRDLARDVSRFPGRATWKRRDVQGDVQAEGCARVGTVRPERCAGSRAGGGC